MKIFFVRHAQTQANIDNSNYTLDDTLHPITVRGEHQAMHTGKYLKNKFGKFDLIISSPRLRCIQTAKLISNEIDYKDDIIINKLIIEDISKIGSGKSKKEVFEKILKKNKKFRELHKQLMKSKDPFECINLKKKLDNIADTILKLSSKDTHKNLINFLNQLKNLNYESILVVSHGGILEQIQKIITNTTLTTLKIYSGDNDKCIKTSQYEDGNTKLMACLLKNGKFKLVIPNNTLHLANFTMKDI